MDNCRYEIRTDERGDILVIFAVCAFLVVLLGIGVTLQRPAEDANAAKLQHALSLAVGEAIFSLTNPGEASRVATKLSHRVMKNELSTEQQGVFGEGINKLYVWIPDIGPGINAMADPVYSDYRIYGCSANGCAACGNPPSAGCPGGNFASQLTIANKVFDPWDAVQNASPKQVDDIFNGVMVVSESKAYRFLPTLNQKTQMAAAAAVLKTHLTYVLIDPAMSMLGLNANNPYGGDLNYDFIFDVPGNALVIDRPAWPAGAHQWPVNAPRDNVNGPPPIDAYSGGSRWQYPGTLGLMSRTPLGDVYAPTNYEIYRFYASMCFNLPWDFYRGAIVDVLDYLGMLSSFSKSTMVGLTGPGPIMDVARPGQTATDSHGLPLMHEAVNPRVDLAWDSSAFDPRSFLADPSVPGSPSIRPVVPIHPVDLAEDPQAHNQSALFVSGLLQQKQQAYRGFVNPSRPDRRAFWGTDNAVGAAADEGSGHNMWELGMCRALIVDNPSDPSSYSLTDDRTCPAEAAGFFSHENSEKRKRQAGAINWCTDEIPAADDVMDLTNSRSGQLESARNLVASLAPRVRNINDSLEEAQNNAAAWNRFDENENMGGRPVHPDYSLAPKNPFSPLSTGWRYLPQSMAAACKHLNEARKKYSQNSLLTNRRPLDDGSDTLVVFAFGVWSPVAREYIRRYKGFNSANALDAFLVQEFDEAVAYCSCKLNIKLIFAFLPLDGFDMWTVQAADSALNKYREYRNYLCGGDLAPAPEPSCVGKDVQAYMLVVDFQNEYFEAEGAYKHWQNEDIIKLDAAKYFRQNVPRTIKRMLTQYVFTL